MSKLKTVLLRALGVGIVVGGLSAIAGCVVTPYYDGYSGYRYHRGYYYNYYPAHRYYYRGYYGRYYYY